MTYATGFLKEMFPVFKLEGHTWSQSQRWFFTRSWQEAFGDMPSDFVCVYDMKVTKKDSDGFPQFEILLTVCRRGDVELRKEHKTFTDRSEAHDWLEWLKGRYHIDEVVEAKGFSITDELFKNDLDCNHTGKKKEVYPYGRNQGYTKLVCCGCNKTMPAKV